MPAAKRLCAVIAAAAAPLACTLLVDVDDGLTSGSPDGGADGLPGNEAEGPDGAPPDVPDASGDGPARETCPSSDPSLVAWFPFDEDGGATAADCSKNALVATSIGTVLPRWTAGRVGGAIDLDGQGTCLQLVSMSSAFAFEGQPFTVAAFVSVRQFFMPVPDKTGRWAISRKSSSRGWHVGSDDPTAVELDLEHDGGKLQTQGSIETSVWRHVAAVYVPGVSTRLYVDGVLREAKAGPPAALGAASDTFVRIGCRSVGANHFDGLLDDLRVYSRALGEDEITALATRPAR